MRIAHISDLHVARTPNLREYTPKRLLGYVNYRLFRGRRYREHVAEEALGELMKTPPDLALLTGDITQHGLDAEFDAAERLLSAVTRAGVPIIAVPGNHDIYGQTDYSRLRRFLNDLRLGLHPDRQGVFHCDTVEILPLAQGIPTPLFFSHGRQNPGELRRAREAWREPAAGKMRLACGHYPVIDPHGGRLLYFRGLRKADTLMEFCRDHGVAGYFCGHDHKRFAAPMPGGCVQYAAPALSSVRHARDEWVSVYICEPGQAHPVDERTFSSRGRPPKMPPPSAYPPET